MEIIISFGSKSTLAVLDRQIVTVSRPSTFWSVVAIMVKVCDMADGVKTKFSVVKLIWSADKKKT